jgi:hypothetical protein
MQDTSMSNILVEFVFKLKVTLSVKGKLIQYLLESQLINL